MRLGVLEVGSNTVQLLVVDARPGGHPAPQLSQESAFELAGQLDADGALTEHGYEFLLETVGESAIAAARLGCEELLAFATSGLRDATNAAEVLASIRRLTGVDLQVRTGIAKARLTFMSVRRWYGWCAGNLLMLDIGDGSLEIAAGPDQEPAMLLSLPLGAGRLHRQVASDPAAAREIAALKNALPGKLSAVSEKVRAAGPFDQAVATSTTFRTLARLTGTAPPSAGPESRALTAADLRRVPALLQGMSSTDIARLEGVSGIRTPRLVAGALIAEAALGALELEQLAICPWALREGIILRRLDQLAVA